MRNIAKAPIPVPVVSEPASPIKDEGHVPEGIAALLEMKKKDEMITALSKRSPDDSIKKTPP